jgi:hypothetical protein
VMGGVTWISKSITQGSLVAVTDGSYIPELFPYLCSAAFVLECSTGCRRIIGSFSESLHVANAYRGNLLGLLAIRVALVGLGASKVRTKWSGVLLSAHLDWLAPYLRTLQAKCALC